MRKKLIAGMAAAVALTAGVAALPASSATPEAGSSKVYVVHGLPLDAKGTKVDVYAGAAGEPASKAGLIANDFTFRSIAGPLTLPAASYDVFIAAPTASNDGALAPGEVIFSKTLAVPAGKNLSAVATFDEAGAPTINVFANAVNAAPAGGGRLSVRHSAAAPAVKVDVGFLPYSRTYRNFVDTYGPASNGQQASVANPAGRYDIVVYAGGARAIGVPSVGVYPGKLTAAYVVGKPGESLTVIRQAIPLG